MCLSPGSLLAPPIVKMWRKIKLPQWNALGKHYTQYALLRDFCCTRACLKGIRIFERLWERRICVPDPAFPRFTFPSLSLLHPRDTHQLRTANWSPPAECLGKAVPWVQVLHLLATLKGLQRLTILTEKFYLISWEFRVLFKFNGGKLVPRLWDFVDQENKKQTIRDIGKELPFPFFFKLYKVHSKAHAPQQERPVRCLRRAAPAHHNQRKTCAAVGTQLSRK